MKKIVLVLFFVLLMGSVLALEKTKIYGMADPGKSVRLDITYTANGVEYSQIITKQAGENNLWELKISTDTGFIDLEVTYNGETEEYRVPTGQDFLVDLELNGENEGVEENVTSSIADETNETNEVNNEVEEDIDEEIIENNEEVGGITGSVISDDLNLDFGNYGLFLAIGGGLFLIIVLANLFSALILGGFRRLSNKEKIPKDIPSFKVKKLSEMKSEREEKREVKPETQEKREEPQKTD